MQQADPNEVPSESYWVTITCFLFITFCMVVISRFNFLAFHALVEIASIVIAVSIFTLAWHARKYLENQYFLIIGTALFYASSLDLIHILAYKGMNIFPGFTADTPTQLWIAARYLHSLSFICAALLINNRIRTITIIGSYSALTGLLVWSIFTPGLFPACFIEGQGLTPFKKNSELVIAALFLISIFLLYRQRSRIDRQVYHLIVAATICSIISELAFIFYVNVYGMSNLVGHIFKLASFGCLYLGIIRTGLENPLKIVFQELKLKENQLASANNQLTTINEQLEQRVQEKTAELLHAQKLESVGRLAGGIAHDFNNKLMVIMGNAELAQTEISENQAVQKRMQEIIKAAGHSRDLTTKLLAFSRQQANDPAIFDPNQVIADSMDSLVLLLGTQVQLQFTPASEIWLIKMDPLQLDQVLLNLAANARDAMPHGGTLQISVTNLVTATAACQAQGSTATEQHVQIVFRDNGTGMPPEMVNHIFEPFFTTKTVGKGTGLGLSAVYGIITQSGGTVHVESQPGEGSSFVILLPRHQQDM